MKITTDRISGPAGSKRAGGSRPGTGGPAFASILSEAEGAETHETAAVRGPGPIDSLLAAQEVPDGTVARRRAVIRGRSILDQLDRLRIALISGAIPSPS